MKSLFVALLLATLAALPTQGADNFFDRNIFSPSPGNPTVHLRALESGGIYTPLVRLSAAGTIATGQAALTTSASLVSAANTARHNILIRNLDAAITIYIGATGVTSATGMPVKAGESIVINTTAALYAVAASGTPSVAYLTEND